LFHQWQQLGQYEHARLDHRTHSPVYVGQAIKQVLSRHPEWQGRIWIDVYGSRYPDRVDHAVLEQKGLDEVVRLHDPVSHREALQRMMESDLLFMSLPDRVDGTPGGRISAKTYEYLMTDRPILAALPPGENRDHLQDKPGVHLSEPKGFSTMATTIEQLASAKFSGRAITVDRSELQSNLSSQARAEAFRTVLTRQTKTSTDRETEIR
jgi:glycosyltransferase involved in cell wall biosynthesis